MIYQNAFVAIGLLVQEGPNELRSIRTSKSPLLSDGRTCQAYYLLSKMLISSGVENFHTAARIEIGTRTHSGLDNTTHLQGKLSNDSIFLPYECP
jgi:hypothetical protein